MIYFTSDTHYWHKTAIEYCRRPFATVEEMNEAMIERWNSRVKPDDSVYHLGDVCFAGKEKAHAILKRLNGQKFLIRGNHDKAFSDQWLSKYFTWVKDFYTLKVDDGLVCQRIVLCHYALRTWEKIHHGAWHLFGHSHGTMKMIINPSMDVGVDCHNYFPISYDEVDQKLSGLKFTATDCHD